MFFWGALILPLIILYCLFFYVGKKEAEALKSCNQLFINKLINFSLASGTIHVHEIKLY